MLALAVALLVFFLALASDYLETRYVRAVNAWESAHHTGECVRAREQAARASVAMWAVGCIGLIAVIKVGWWVIGLEGLGLYFGTKLAMRR